jgi:hypothetical protein
MRLKGFVAALLLLLLGEFAFSQRISHEVLVPAANIVTKGNYIYQQTIGEPVVMLVEANGYDLTQGFQQPRVIIDDGKCCPGNGAESYPNPVVDILTVKLWGDTYRDMKISLYNFQGVLLFETERNYLTAYMELIEIPVSSYKPGVYFVRVTSSDKVIIRTFKIEKM